MDAISEIGRNVMVMISSVLIAIVFVLFIVVALFYFFKSQFTPDKMAAFFFGG